MRDFRALAPAFMVATCMVRIVLALAVVAAFACGGAPLPSSQAPPPGAAASDILGYLPVDSELVVGIDFRLLRSSALWREYRPVFVAALDDKFALVTSNCGFDPLEAIESLAVAGPDNDNLVAVIRGWDRDLSIACVRAANAKDNVRMVGHDLITLTRKDGSTSVASFVDRTTVVMDASKHPSERRLREVLGSGVPLRRSEAFLAMYDRLEHDVALWFVLNGNGTIGDGLAALGLRPQGIYGTVRVAANLSSTIRLRLPTADKAQKLAWKVDSESRRFRQMVDHLAITADGDVATISLGLSPDRLRALVKSSGVMAGTRQTL